MANDLQTSADLNSCRCCSSDLNPPFDSWGGLIAPLNTPQAIVDRIATETQAIIQSDKELQQKLLSAGAIASFQDGKQMQARLNKDYERWSSIVKNKGISAL